MSLLSLSACSTEVRMVFWGELSPQMLQKIIVAVKADLTNAADGILDMSLIDMICSLGTDGVHSSNTSRDLMRRLQKPAVPSTHVFEVSVDNPLLTTAGVASMKMLYPHEMFAALYHHYREAFLRVI